MNLRLLIIGIILQVYLRSYNTSYEDIYKPCFVRRYEGTKVYMYEGTKVKVMKEPSFVPSLEGFWRECAKNTGPDLA